MTTQKEVRAAFWAAWREGLFKGANVTPRKGPDYSGKGRMHNTDTRSAFCDFVDGLSKNGELADGLADRVTLGSPYELASGLTWSEQTPGHDYSEAYDRGVNAGQIVGAAIRFKPTKAQPFTGGFFTVRGMLP